MESQSQYVCPFIECAKHFKSRKSLVEHLRIHKGEKPYSCRVDGCDRRFTQYSSMQKHERTHTGDKPYKCGLCDRHFTQISNLKRHERVHAGEKPHVCEFCQKRFSTASNLKQHVIIHQRGEFRAKFFCNICEKSYLYRSSLRKHLLEHGAGMFDLKIEDGYGDLQVKAEVEERYYEPQFSKYVFVDPTQTIRAFPAEPMQYKAEYIPEYQGPRETFHEAYMPQPSMRYDYEPYNPSPVQSKPAEYEPKTKMASLADLLGSPLRDDPAKESRIDNPATFLGQKNSSTLVNYKGELYYLYDRTLNRVKPTGEIEIREIENDSVNPSRGDPLSETSHCRTYETSECSIKGKAGSDQLNSFIINDDMDPPSPHAFLKHEVFEHPLEMLFYSRIEENGSKSKEGRRCLCDSAKHVHGSGCGHLAIMHDGHIDYIVNGKLHHQNGEHCEDHGPIFIVENAHDDYAFNIMSNRFQPDCKMEFLKGWGC